jgi:hypothetical protein
MRKLFLIILTVILTASFAVAQTKVNRIILTSGIENKEPLAPVTNIIEGTENLVCFTEIQSNEYPTEITHIWIHNQNIEAEVKLNVGSPKWRTYSTKNIPLGKTGAWKVEIYAKDGKLIDSVDFTVNEQ